MKKITRILILVVMLLTFVHPQSRFAQAITASTTNTHKSRPPYTATTAQSVPDEDSGWVIECLDCESQTKEFGGLNEHNLQLDQNGYPHIIYGYTLYYAWNDGTDWHYEDVAWLNCPSYMASLSLDAKGFPHISCSSGYPDYLLMYGFKDSSGWHVEAIVSAGRIGDDTSLDLDKDGNPHIIFKDKNNDTIRHAYKNTIGFQIEVVCTSCGGWNFPHSMEIDDLGYPHFVWEYQGDLFYTHREADGWFSEIAVSNGSIIGISMALDGDGNPHIGYLTSSIDVTYEGLHYAYRNEQIWHIEHVEHNKGISGLSIDVDPEGESHISYGDINNNQIRYARRDPAGWQTIAVDIGVGGSSLTLDENGYPHIIYLNQTNNYDSAVLKYSYQDSTGWNFVPVDRQWTLESSSLVLDRRGHPHIAFGGEHLYYKWFDGMEWHHEIVDSFPQVGDSLSLVMDDSGFPHISYQDENNYDLKYASKDPSGWNIVTVDSQGFVGFQTSLVLDKNGVPHISYIEGMAVENSILKYATKDDNGWQIQIVDKEGLSTGVGSSIALYKNGYLRISYIHMADYGDFSLRYAVMDENEWHIQRVAAAWAWDTALALDVKGLPHIIYSGELDYYWLPQSYYSFQTDEEWQFELRLPFAGASDCYSLVIDDEGKLHVVGGIYQFRDVRGWHSYVFDPDYYQESRNPNSSSITIDANGNPHISYIAGESHDLKYAVHTGSFYISTFLPMVQRD